VEDESDVHAMEQLKKELSEEMQEFSEELPSMVCPRSLFNAPRSTRTLLLIFYGCGG